MNRQKVNRIKQLLAVAVLTAVATFFSSCRNDIVYSQFYPIESGEWHIDSVARFDYTIADKQAAYRMIVYIRHTEKYPYQNMWLFIGDSLRRDTIEFYLADDRGQWLGDKHHGFIEMPVLIEDNYHFQDTGKHVLEVQQGMRDSLLRGVMDVGMEVRMEN